MYRVCWAPSDFSTMLTRWFHSKTAALAFAKTRKIAIVYDPDGKQIY
jgi:hypothetical protein